jgi:hypothetical protein
MTTKVNYPVVFGVPAAFVASMVVAYFVLVLAGFERERALDCVSVSLVISVLAFLRGVRRVPHRILSVELGVLLAILLSSGALALRAISLAPARGPLFYFSIVSSAGLGYMAIRFMRRMMREVASGADPQGTLPPNGPFLR